jgi:sensor domain CHASE-containing protein
MSSIRTKVTVSVLSILGLSLAVLGVGLKLVLTERFESLEEREVLVNVGRVEEVIHDRMSYPADKIKDWAFWDDTYQFVQDKNQKYLDANISAATLDNLAIDSLRIYNLEGEDLALLDKVTTEGKSAFLEPIEDTFKKYPSLTKLENGKEIAKGMLSGKDQLISYAVSPVMPASGEGEPKGLMVFLKIVDKDYVTRLSELTKIPIELVNFGTSAERIQASAAFAKRFQNSIESKFRGISRSGFVIPNADYVEFASEIKDASGAPIGLYRGTLTRELVQEGKRTLQMVLSGLVVVSAFMLGFLLFSLNTHESRVLVPVGAPGLT